MAIAKALLLLALPLSLVLAADGAAIDAPASARAWSFPIDPAAAHRIDPLPARELAKDDVFVAELDGVLRSSLSREAMVDSLTLMLDKIAWLFAGAVPLAPRHGYLGTFQIHIVTFRLYQDALVSHAAAAPKFASIARSACGENVVRCSSALLLVALLDREAAAREVRWMLETSAHRSAEVPEILVHALAMAAALTRDPDVALALAPLLDRLDAEESREDILCVLAHLAPPEKTIALITGFLERELPVRHDNAVQAGLFIVCHRMDDGAFRTWYEALRGGLAPERRRLLEGFAEDGFPLPMLDNTRSFVKIWDGFDVTLYNDGVHLYQPRFSYFLSYP